jgi:transcriptional regulator with XRE-family HTH domain
MLLDGDTLAQKFDVGTRPGDGTETTVSERVVALRKERGLTLQECARLSGVAASTLSKIERNELSPTISTLQKIAGGFELEVTEFLSNARPAGSGQGRRAVSRAGEGKPHTSVTCANFLLCNDLKYKRMVPIRTRVTARSVEEYQVWAKSDAEIFLSIVSGTMLLHSKIYEPLELGPGDSVYYDASSEHCWTTAGDEDAEVIWVMTA